MYAKNARMTLLRLRQRGLGAAETTPLAGGAGSQSQDKGDRSDASIRQKAEAKPGCKGRALLARMCDRPVTAASHARMRRAGWVSKQKFAERSDSPPRVPL